MAEQELLIRKHRCPLHFFLWLNYDIRCPLYLIIIFFSSILCCSPGFEFRRLGCIVGSNYDLVTHSFCRFQVTYYPFILLLPGLYRFTGLAGFSSSGRHHQELSQSRCTSSIQYLSLLFSIRSCSSHPALKGLKSLGIHILINSHSCS